ncbi:MAG: DUF1326 domain-containing protein [Alphaproteobacteria bacterium]
MADNVWEVHGHEFVNCNCNYGCPCQFNALPTDGTCTGVGAIHIESGFHGNVRLDGLNVVWLLHWPNPIHLGNGVTQAVIDERANDEQREALSRILYGFDTEMGATHWQVFSTTMTTTLPALFMPVDFEVDVESRQAKLKVPGLIDALGTPIRNPVTGEEHRVRIDLPNGFEYSLAEMGSGSSTVTGDIPMELKDSYGQFADIHLSNVGIIKEMAA